MTHSGRAADPCGVGVRVALAVLGLQCALAHAQVKTLTLDAAAQSRYGVVVQPLRAAAAPASRATTARVLDPSMLFQLDNELVTAQASLAASRAEAERTRKLFAEDRTASARTLEIALAQEQADLQRVNGAHQRLALEWGGALADLAPERRAELLKDLIQGRAELIRVELPPGLAVPKAGTALNVRGNSESDARTGRVLGPLPLADPRLQTRGVLAELRGPQATLPLGAMLLAELPTTSRGTGVVLPRSALLRRDSRVWVYVQTAPSQFIRREVHANQPLASGWFVDQGFAPGEQVVVEGAAALLGIENPAQAQTGND